MAELSGKVQTVCGLISPDKVGITLTHEHLSIDASPLFLPPADPKLRDKLNLAVTLENLYWIRQNPYSNYANLDLTDEGEVILEELKHYKYNGGSTIVDNTTCGIKSDVRALKKLSEESGVNVIAGAGFYVETSRPAETWQMSQEKMAEVIRTEITVGRDSTDIKCGVIGELGCSWPLGDSEKRVLQAAASVQSELGCPVIIHPGRNHEAPVEIIRIFQEAGGNVEKTVMSHLDRTFFDDGALLEFASLGSYCEYDLFGIEVSHYQHSDVVDMPSDAQRIQKIKTLISEGYLDKIVIAHDIHTKHRLMRYGGHGFSHILLNVVPKMAERGISYEQIHKIHIDNPQAWLTFT